MSEVPVFPLPNVVLFPKTLLPLHIFEPRYREMVRDALAGERLIAMALLKPGWERDYYGNPEIFEVGCLGQIQQVEELPDGRYNILLLGLAKARLLRTIAVKPYRTAEIELLEDRRSLESEEIEKDRLLLIFRRLLAELDRSLPDISPLRSLSFEAFVNTITSLLDISVYDKQQLLELPDLAMRSCRLKALLEERLRLVLLYKAHRHMAPEDPDVN